MRRISRLVLTAASAAMLAVSGASLAMAAHHHHSHAHTHRYATTSRAPVQGGVGQYSGDPPATPGSVGSWFGGLGGDYDNSAFGYGGPLGFGLRAKAQIGSALIGGGAAGDAYTDYLQHYYYYKYDACPLGSKYLWYLRRCFSPLDLFR